MMRRRFRAAALLLPLLVCQCAHSGLSKGTEPAVKVMDVDLPVDNGTARVHFEISNLNDFPITLTRVSLEMGGKFQGPNLPSYDSVYLEVPAHDTGEISIEFAVNRVIEYQGTGPIIPSGVTPSTGASGPDLGNDDQITRIVLMGNLSFSTPNGKLKKKIREQREV